MSWLRPKASSTYAVYSGALLATLGCGGQSSADAVARVQPPPALLDACEAQVARAGAALIDDFEDGDLHLNERDRFRGAWYLNNDGTGTQLPPVMVDSAPAPLLEGPGAPTSPQLALHTSGSNFSLWGAFVAARFNAEQGKVCTFDLSQFDRISFSAKGVGSVRVNLGTLTTTPVEDGGACGLAVCSDYGQDVTLSDDWQAVDIDFAELTQPRWASPAAWAPEQALRLAFWSGSGDFDFWIDDVRFERSP
ncbi:MAG TPA: hypothetical protein VHP33_02545 [Polyangiaceae bacterium]|nr:hypothetical protein [Polyangiaceae bacterium]